MYLVYAGYSRIDFLNLDYIESIDLCADRTETKFCLIAWGPSSDFEDNSERSQYEIMCGNYDNCINTANAIIEAMKNHANVIDIRPFYECEGEEQ